MTKFIFWGLTASPYQLKMQSLLDFAGHDWERWPAQAGRVAAVSMAVRLDVAKRRRAIKRYPEMSHELDEYPSVPFYTLDERTFYYDSSSLACHLDQHPQRYSQLLIPQNPKMAFIAQLIDEAFDEFGLYMVHHMRWVGSTRTTPMGEMTAREFSKLLPPGLTSLMAGHLHRRQTRRCPYLFSVAPAGFDAGVSRARTPPSRAHFPPTHALLDKAWRTYLAAMEQVFSEQPFLLGARFTLADASAYGQLGMNLVDPEAVALMEELAPRTYRWLCAIRDGKHAFQSGNLPGTPPGNQLEGPALTSALKPLLQIISQTFIPLMTQNEDAYLNAVAAGETQFNEVAFNRNRALYNGQLLDYPFRAVVKTFQVRVWRALKDSWRALDQADRGSLEREYLPDAAAMFGGSGVLSGL